MSAGDLPGAGPKGPREPDPRLRGSYPRALTISLGVSALFHVGVLLLYSSLRLHIPTGQLGLGRGGAERADHGMELVELEVVPPDEEAASRQPREEVGVEVQPSPSVGGGNLEPQPLSVSGTGEARRPSHAERLAPNEGDLRLWAPVDPSRVAPTPMEVLRLQLLWELEALADSAAVAEALARKALDWTYADGQGRRWGISPGKLHLGDITLPLPFALGPSPETRDKVQSRIWEWEEIQRGAAGAGVRQSWKERDEAIRKRMETQRKPDSTRRGGGV